MVLINLKTQNTTCLQKPQESKPKTHNKIHITMCRNGICTKHKKPITTNVCVLKSQIIEKYLRTHNLGLYPTHEIN